MKCLLHILQTCDKITGKKLLSNDPSFIINKRGKKIIRCPIALQFINSLCGYILDNNILYYAIMVVYILYLLQITIGQYLLIFINKNGRPSIQFPEFLIQCLIRHIISTDVTINSVISAGWYCVAVQFICASTNSESFVIVI